MSYDYPSIAHERIHGPGGYSDYTTFKEWLRDEFEFRCVYCLTREKWSDAGHQMFGVDHVLPKATHKSLECEYTNLVYCCNRCNSAKLLGELFDPCREALGKHLSMGDSGEVGWLTTEGQKIVRGLKLNDPDRVRFRRVMNRFVQCAVRVPDGQLAQELRDLMGYPGDLPDLSQLRPPNNSKPEGIAMSHFERRKRGELPDLYSPRAAAGPAAKS